MPHKVEIRKRGYHTYRTTVTPRPGFEQALSVSLSPGEGFGEHLEELTYVDELDNVPEEYRHVGAEIEFQNDIGESRIFRVTHIDSDTLTVDGNHPFAGKNLVFTITVQAVRDASAEEISRGHNVPADADTRLH